MWAAFAYVRPLFLNGKRSCSHYTDVHYYSHGDCSCSLHGHGISSYQVWSSYPFDETNLIFWTKLFRMIFLAKRFHRFAFVKNTEKILVRRCILIIYTCSFPRSPLWSLIRFHVASCSVVRGFAVVTLKLTPAFNFLRKWILIFRNGSLRVLLSYHLNGFLKNCNVFCLS